MLKFAIFFVVIFCIGAGFGSQLAPTADVEFIEVPKTKIVYKDPTPDPPPPTPIAQLPESCVYALVYAQKAVDNAEHIYHSGEEQIQIIGNARIALYDESFPDLQLVQENQQKLSNSTVGYLADMEEALSTYETALKKCEEDQ